MSKPDCDPREYCKIRYSAPPGSCKCGNCQLVPPDRLIAWSDALENIENLREQLVTARGLLTEFLCAAVPDDAKKRTVAFLTDDGTP